jgi:hypothetical protein
MELVGDDVPISDDGPISRPQLRTPRAAATAGIAFALLLSVSLTLIWATLSTDPAAGSGQLERQGTTLRFAFGLVPFAGIAFLWFIGVARDRIGELEDRFFATVLLGSGLLYLAMTFVATGIAGGLLTVAGTAPDEATWVSLYSYGRSITYTIVTMYAMRMASVFMIVLGTIWLRTRTMPRWMALGTYATALVLLVTVTQSLWAILVFPSWVLVVSTSILIASWRSDGSPDQR